MIQSPIQVLLADDHDILREGIRRILSNTNDINVIGEAGTGEEVLKLVRELRPDLVLLDINMPGIGGMEVTQRLSRTYPNIKVLALTAYAEEPFPSRMMQAGCSGYLTKGSSAKEIEHAIRSIVRSGKKHMSPDVAQQLAMRHVAGGAKSDKYLSFDNLSNRELEVFLMIAKGKKPKEIASILNLSDKTVNTYRYRLFDKLGVKGDVALAKLAYETNMIDPGSIQQSDSDES